VEEFWNEGNISAADELMAIDAEIHMPTGEMVDLNGSKGSPVHFADHSLTGIQPSRS
jgi:hypothetical protein